MRVHSISALHWTVLIALYGAPSCRSFDNADPLAPTQGGANGGQLDGNEAVVGANGGTPPGSQGGASGGSSGEAGTGASQAGEAGATSGGTGHNAGTGGGQGGGGTEDMIEEMPTPYCVSDATGVDNVVIGASPAVDVAISGNWNESTYLAFAAQESVNNVAQKWKVPGAPTASWDPWICFDFVPSVSRITALNLVTDFPEIYASTRTNRLFVRRQYLYLGWGPWVELSTPPGELRDIVAVVPPSGIVSLYVAAGGIVSFRTKTSDAANASYGPWSSIDGLSGVKAIAAHALSNDTDQIFAIDSLGAVSETLRTTGDDQSFTWTSVTAPPNLVDIDASRDALGEPFVVAVDADGALWQRSLAEESGWDQLKAGEDAPKLVSIDAAALSGQIPMYVGTAEDGKIYRWVGEGTSWLELN